MTSGRPSFACRGARELGEARPRLVELEAAAGERAQHHKARRDAVSREQSLRLLLLGWRNLQSDLAGGGGSLTRRKRQASPQ
jgi:hypothetical protein